MMNKSSLATITTLCALVGCGGTAQLSVSTTSTTSLAESIAAAADEAGAPAASPALLAHVLRTEAHVATGDGDADRGSPAGNVGPPEGDDAREDIGGLAVVSDTARDVDLFALSSSVEEIANGVIPSGRLTQLRLVLDANQPATLVVDDTETAVDVPSAAQSGLKLLLVPPVLAAPGAEVSVTAEISGLVEAADGGLIFTPAIVLGTDVPAD